MRARAIDPNQPRSASIARKRLGSVTCLGSIELGLVFRNLAKVFERKPTDNAFTQIAAVQRNPSTQKFGAIFLHQSKLGETTTPGL